MTKKVKQGLVAHAAYQEAERLASKRRRTPKDLRSALRLLRNAAENNHAHALYAIGNWYVHGIAVRRNYRMAADSFERAVNLGDVDACSQLALCYELGHGRKRDLKQALLLYRRAAEGGDVAALVEVARFHYYGIATKKNESIAARHYLEAAKRGDVRAQYWTAVNYELGIGLRKNRRFALHWYAQAAAQGDKVARRTLKKLSVDDLRTHG